MPKPEVPGRKTNQSRVAQKVCHRSWPRGGIQAASRENYRRCGCLVRNKTGHKLYNGGPV